MATMSKAKVRGIPARQPKEPRELSFRRVVLWLLACAASYALARVVGQVVAALLALLLATFHWSDAVTGRVLFMVLVIIPPMLFVLPWDYHAAEHPGDFVWGMSYAWLGAAYLGVLAATSFAPGTLSVAAAISYRSGPQWAPFAWVLVVLAVSAAGRAVWKVYRLRKESR
jgi:hypothetical protein